MTQDEQIISLLKELIQAVNKLDKTQQNILTLFKKYDDDYIQEIEKEGIIEKS